MKNHIIDVTNRKHKLFNKNVNDEIDPLRF